MKQYEAYLFDMDGTITETFEPWLEIVQETLDEYHIQADTKTIIRKIFGASESGLIELGVPEQDLESIFQIWDTKADRVMGEASLYPGIVEVLVRLKQKGKKLALITATSRSTVEVILQAHGLEDVFDSVVTDNEMELPKPDPGGLLLAVRAMDISPSNTVMIGDSEKDIQAAHNAGMHSALFFPPTHDYFHSKTELIAENPTYVINSWDELLTESGL
jgi:pyrophosphatase PpaX